MKVTNKNKISLRLALIGVTAALLLGIVVSLIQLSQDFSRETRSIETVIQRTLTQHISSATLAAYHLDKRFAQELVDSFRVLEFIVSVSMFDELGNILAAKNIETRPSRTSWLTGLLTQETKSYAKQLVRNETSSGPVGKLVVVVDNDHVLTPFYNRAISTIMLEILKDGVLVLLLFIVFYYLITRPLTQLASSIDQIDPGKPERTRLPIIPGHEQDELGLIATATNRFLDENAQNLSQRLQAENALRKSEEQFDRAMQGSSDGFWDWDNTSSPPKSWWSPRYFSLLGYKEGEIEPGLESWMELAHSEDRSRVFEARRRQLEEHKPFDVEYRMKAKSGEYRWYRYRGQGTWNAEGKPIRMSGSMQDITDRKEAEEALRRLRNLLSNIVDSMPSIIVGTDADGKITQWNLAAENVSGVSVDIALGQLLPEVLPQLTDEMQAIYDVIQQKQPQQQHRIAVELDKDPRLWDVIIYPLVTKGTEGAVIRIDDVTERVKIDEMIVQSEKMLSVGGLAAGMAHEINNPLAGILQGVQVIRSRLTDNLPKNIDVAKQHGLSMQSISDYMQDRKIPELIDSVSVSSRRAAKIVENMLSFSRKSEAYLQPCNLSELLDRTLELVENDYDLKKHYDFRQIKIIREYDQSMPNVYCEESKIQQVFLNILKNGAEAMAAATEAVERNNVHANNGPRLILRVSKVDELARIEIEDNGPGMNEQIRKRVFEPFFTTKGVVSGTGLGLSVSYFIITETHGGRMQVESNPGSDTRFTIDLPIRQSGLNS